MSDRKAAFITGCNGGIGRSLCEAFEQAGFVVIATDREEVSDSIGDLYIPLDLERLVAETATQSALQTRVHEWLSQSGARLGVLVNNAAIQITGSFDSVSIEAFEQSHRVNVAAPYALAQLFAEDLRAVKGTIINIGSIHSRLTKPGFCAYSVAKAGLAGLTRALALDLGGEVTVNTIAPAAIRTSMLEAGFTGQPDQLADLARHHPAGRIGEPEELARLAVFLASDDARFITGAELCADGGISVRLHDPA